jgi:hypothetical protein
MSTDATHPEQRPNSVAGGAIVFLLLAVALLAWHVGGSMSQRPAFPLLLTTTAVVLALATPYRLVRLALLSVSPKLDGQE